MKDNPFKYLSFGMQYSCTNLGYELKFDSAEKRDVQQLKNKKLNRPSIVKNTLMLFQSSPPITSSNHNCSTSSIYKTNKNLNCKHPRELHDSQSN